MPPLLMGVVILINVTALFLFVSLLVRASPKQDPHSVFIEFVNASGLPDEATFFIALLPAFSCLGGFDNATHLTDELENPTKQVPQVILGSFLMSFFTTIPMILVYEFCNVDPESLLAPIGEQPYLQLLLNAYRSEALAIVGTVLIIVCIGVAGCSCLISASRLAPRASTGLLAARRLYLYTASCQSSHPRTVSPYTPCCGSASSRSAWELSALAR
ncbi:hypothetical protein ONS95_011669 [Cadophora gregata]|uniref:uncharacterized protein n=1 Tax=Cadophora gregata TaxID=51156 RepID=UPI0026DC7B9E|nr:uncharacterized protein ONS95_011669 [Cadophora gregata]KAK0120264.1 hypothetical protein ONS95_011669 [Cadophora gregata]KAK0121298.1 hypothetical protein ONS96_011472 [Cadophora gregata f. sp. sojae]